MLFINELVHSQFKRGGVEQLKIRLLIETFGSNLGRINNRGKLTDGKSHMLVKWAEALW